MNKHEFNALAGRLKQGDADAAGKIFDSMAPQIYRFFLARTGHRENAEDLMQDVFLRLVGRIESFDPAQGDFTPWFWRIAHNALIDQFRQKKTAYLADIEGEGENIADPNERMVASAELRELMDSVRTLDPEDQELLQLHFISDMSYKDLAAVTGKAENNLRVIIHRLKQKLLKRYDPSN